MSDDEQCARRALQMTQQARLKAQIEQQRRLEKLQPRCPCGEKCWPCDCPVKWGMVLKLDEERRDPCSGRLPAAPIFFDEGKRCSTD